MADLTYVAAGKGFAHAAFVIDAFSRRRVGRRVMDSLKAELALEGLEQAIVARAEANELIHHSDRVTQYLSLRYTERRRGAEIAASVGSAGDAYDNALAETVIGQYKTELIGPGGRWRDAVSVEAAALAWVDWFNNHRLPAPLGHAPPAEFEAMYDRDHGASKVEVCVT